MAEEFRVLLGVELDTSAIDTKMNALKTSIQGLGHTNPIKLTMDSSSVTSQIKAIKRQIQSISDIKINLNSGSGGSGTVNALSKSYRELLNLANQIGNMETKIGGLRSASGHNNQISVLENQLKSLQTTYQQLMNSFINSGGLTSGQFDIGDMTKLQSALDKSKTKLAELDAKLADTKAKLASDIVLKFDKGLDADLEKVSVGFDKIKVKSKEAESAMQKFNNAANNMEIAKQSGDVDRIIACYDKYKIALQNIDFQIKKNQRTEKESFNAEKLQQNKIALSSQMDVWLKNNSAAASQFGAKIEALKAELKSCDATRLNGIQAEFQEIKRQADLAGKATLTFSDKLSAQLSKLGTYFSAITLITQSARAIRSMYDEVLKVDTAMTDLYRVTDLTSKQYDELYDKMTQSAEKYGATLDGLISSTASWVRLGFNPDDSNRLAEITAMYQHVTDLDEDTAVKNLVTAYKGFEEQLLQLNDNDATKAVEQIADVYDILGRHNCP